MGGTHKRAFRPAQHSEPEPPQTLSGPVYPHATMPDSLSPQQPTSEDDAPVLPTRAGEDTPEAWGELSDSNDRRLQDNVPPHW